MSQNEILPPGWKKVESRSKPGTFYYAHAASNRTQVEAPPGTKRAADPKANSVETPDPVKEAEQHRQIAAAEARRKAAEAEAALRREQRLKECEDEDEAEAELVQQQMRKAKAAKKAKEEEEQRRKEEALRLEKERKEKEEEDRRKRLEAEELARQQAAAYEALAQQKRQQEAEIRRKEEEAKRRKALFFEQSLKAAEEARKKQAEEEQEAERAAEEAQKLLEAKKEEAKAARLAAAKAKDASIWNQVIPDPNYEIFDPCFEVFKAGRRVCRHLLLGGDRSWMLGRGPEGVNIPFANDRISRKHAEISSQGGLMFITDLGSKYGTAMNGNPIDKHTPVEFARGARFRFGGLPEVFVFREPNAQRKPGVKRHRARDIECSIYGAGQSMSDDEFSPIEGDDIESAQTPLVGDYSPSAGAASPSDDDLQMPPDLVDNSSPAEPDPEAVAAESAAAAAAAAEEEEARLKRIQQKAQQKREERKAAAAAAAAELAAKKEEERRLKEERKQNKAATKAAKAAKKVAKATQMTEGNIDAAAQDDMNTPFKTEGSSEINQDDEFRKKRRTASPERSGPEVKGEHSLEQTQDESDMAAEEPVPEQCSFF